MCLMMFDDQCIVVKKMIVDWEQAMVKTYRLIIGSNKTALSDDTCGQIMVGMEVELIITLFFIRMERA